MVWPFFAFGGASEPQAGRGPDLSPDEVEIQSRVMAKAHRERLAPSDLEELRIMLGRYVKRSGRYLTKGEYESFVYAMRLSADYQYELGKSVLQSWDSRQYMTTTRFDELFSKMKRFRKPQKLDNDIETLKAAARHQTYIADEKGLEREFARDIILEGLREADLARSNSELIASIFGEVVK